MKGCFDPLVSCLIAFFLYFASLQGQSTFIPIFKISAPSGYNYLDSLSDELSKDLSIEVRLGIINDLAYYWHTRDLDKADSIAIEGIAQADKAEMVYQKALLEVTRAAILLRAEKLDLAETLLLNALKNIEKRDYPMAYTQLGYVEERRGNLDKAIFYANKNHMLGTELDDLWVQAMALSDLSNLFWKQSQYKEGLEYGLRSLSIFEKRGIQDLDYDFTLYIVANNYIALGQINEALIYLHQSIELGEKYGFFNNLSDAYIAEIDLYTDTDQFAKAQYSYDQSMKYALLLKNAFMEMRTLLSLGRLRNKEMRYADAISSLEKSLSIATSKFGDDFYLAAVYRELSLAYQGLGDYKRAFEALTSHHTYQDSVLTKEANERMAELQTLYETAQKETTITEQTARLSRQNTVMFFVIGILGLVGLSSFLLLRLNRQLKNRNQEKDVLLKEIHHRVKNNLQILSSLLSLQSQYIKDEKALDAIQEGRNRVESMGLIHQKLFSADNITGVDMKDYVSQLCDYLKQSFSADNRKIEVDNEVQIELMDIDSAIPLGLIINELITNTRKYAVTKDKVCRIMIKLWIDNEKNLCLRVSDNGIASEKVAIEYSSTSFGTDLVKILSKKLKGTVEINTDNGYQTLIKFKRYKLLKKSYSYVSN